MLEVINEVGKREAEERFNKFIFEYGLEPKTYLSSGEIVTSLESPDISNGVGQIVGGIVGGVAGFFVGGAAGAIAGASLGMAIGSSFDKKPDKNTKKPRPTYAFSTAGDVQSLAKQGDVIPVIYCNSVKNSKGGVRYSGKIISSRIENINDTSILYQVYAIGLGRIGAFDFSRTLVNNQTTNQFYPEDFEFEFLPGLPTIYEAGIQTGFQNTEFNLLAHTAAPNTFNTCGVNLRALSRSAASTGASVDIAGWDTFNCYISGKSIVKNSGIGFTPDALAYTRDTINEGGGSFSWKVVSSAEHIAGFGAAGGSLNIDYNLNTKQGGVLEANIGNTKFTTNLAGDPLTWAVNDILKVVLTYDNTGQKIVNFAKNGNTILTVDANWGINQVAKVVLFNIGQSFQIETASGLFFATSIYGTQITSSGGGEALLTVFEDDKNSEDNYAKFTAGENYLVNRQRFRVIQKYPTNRQLRISPSVTVGDEDEVYAIWETYYQTARRCNEITLNLQGLFYSRPKPESGGK